MEYNKKQFHKTNDKKILHKIGKHWVSIGLSTLVAIGGAAATQVKGVAADSVNQNNANHSTQSINSTQQSKPATLVSASASQRPSQNQSSSSSSIDLNNLQHQANNLHTKILNHSLQKTSAVNSDSSKSGQDTSSVSSSSASAKASSAASSAISQSPLNSLAAASGSANKSKGQANRSNQASKSANKSSQAVNNSITVQYFNQHNKMVGSGTISNRSSGTRIDVINPQEGGIPIPNGYIFNNNQDPNATFNSSAQVMQFGVSGKTVSGSIDVDIIKKNIEGSLASSTQAISVSGKVGDAVDIQPKDYVPARISADDYYYIDPGDHSISLTVHPADAQHPIAYFTPNHVQYQYDESKKSPQMTGIIVVHYRDIDTDGKINNIDVRGGINTPFKLRNYQSNVPQDYYYVKTAPYMAGLSIPQTFQKQTQDVIVYVHPLLYLRANLQFQDVSDNNNVVNTRVLMAKSKNKPIDYQFLAEHYTPDGYIPVGFGKNNDPILKDKDTDVIYIKHGENGLINIQYIYNHKIVGTASDRKPLNQSFSISHYLDHAPAGYKPANQVISGQNVNQFRKVPQLVKIGVVPENSDTNKATVYMTYRNINDPNNVVKTVSDSGTPGTTIDYSAYEKAPNLPQNYTFAYLDSAVDHQFANGDRENIFVKPVEKPGHATVYIDYRDVNNIGHILKTVSDSGKPGALIDYSQFKKSPKLPDGYKFVAPLSTDSTFSNNAHESLLVKKINQPNPKPSSDVIGTIIYQNYKNGSTAGQATIKGPENEAINYGQYINGDSQYMPSGYQFYKFGPHGQYLEANAKYYILVKPVNPSQPKGTIDVNYQDSSDNNKIVKNYHLQQPSGTQFNVGDYVNQIPSGYVFDRLSSGSNIDQFNNQAQTVDIIVSQQNKPLPQVHETLVYQDSRNSSDVNTIPLNGSQGTPVDYTNYIKSVPSGYTFDKLADGDTSTLQNNGHYVILVTPVHHHSDQTHQVDANLVYQNAKTNSDVSEEPLNGQQGTSVDYSSYIDSIPRGYTFDRLADGDAKTLQDNGKYVILVNASDQQVNTKLIYRDIKTDSDVNEVPLSGQQGTQIDYLKYTNSSQIPSGYTFERLADGDTNTLQPNGNYIVWVTRNNHQIDDPLIYKDVANGSRVGQAYTLYGTTGQSIDFSQYDDNNSSYMPKGYHFVSNPSNDTLEPGQQYDIMVAANHATQDGHITVNYRNASDADRILISHTFTRPVGSAFNLQKFLNVIPASYQFAGLMNNSNRVTKFTNGNQTVDILVKASHSNGGNVTPTPTPKPTSAKKGLITFIYVTPNNHVISKYSDQRPIGTSFDSNDYVNWLPSGYRADGIVSGGNVNRFTASPQSVIVQVSSLAPKPAPQPQPSSNSSSASSSSVAPSPAPSPSSSSSSNSASSSNSMPSSSSQPSQSSSHSASNSNSQPSSAQSSNSSSNSSSNPSSAISSGTNSAPTSQPGKPGHRSAANPGNPGSRYPGSRSHSYAASIGNNGGPYHRSNGYLASSIASNVASAGTTSQNSSNGQNGRLPQTGEQMNSRVMDIFAWLALASLISMWGAATDRRHNR